MKGVWREIGAYLGLIEMTDEEWQQLACKRGNHDWNLTQREVTQVPLMKCTNGEAHKQVGWEYIPIKGPSYHKCKHCPAMEEV